MCVTTFLLYQTVKQLEWSRCGKPHGNKPFLPTVVTTLAFIFSILAAGRTCHYVNYTGTWINDMATGGDVYNKTSTSPLGLWSYAYPRADTGEMECVPYNVQSIRGGDGFMKLGFEGFVYYADARYRAAKAFSILSSVVGGVVMIVLWVTPCVKLLPKVWGIMADLLVVNAIFEGLVLLFLTSDWCRGENSCTLSWAGICGIVAIPLWLLGGLLCCTIVPLDMLKGDEAGEASNDDLLLESGEVSEKISSVKREGVEMVQISQEYDNEDGSEGSET